MTTNLNDSTLRECVMDAAAVDLPALSELRQRIVRSAFLVDGLAAHALTAPVDPAHPRTICCAQINTTQLLEALALAQNAALVEAIAKHTCIRNKANPVGWVRVACSGASICGYAPGAAGQTCTVTLHCRDVPDLMSVPYGPLKGLVIPVLDHPHPLFMETGDWLRWAVICSRTGKRRIDTAIAWDIFFDEGPGPNTGAQNGHDADLDEHPTDCRWCAIKALNPDARGEYYAQLALDDDEVLGVLFTPGPVSAASAAVSAAIPVSVVEHEQESATAAPAVVVAITEDEALEWRAIRGPIK